ncbi:MAG: NAD-dependent epimerase/dehydratase family protein [Alphaproteobacteria bacterium]|nr:NAD-dependent epimerase/dehydratase family protein [Alphaproteobacteria bacterium]MBM3950472.1 NAD-dependent epimerase/dehydratase family protein [Rhodospirillales bacterium]
MTVLVTGAAGFIGYHVAAALLARGESVLGLDNVNAYYDVKLKETRLERLRAAKNFAFVRADVADADALAASFAAHPAIDRIVHLAAQAGVRHSLKEPMAYVRSNVGGQVALLEAVRRQPKLRHFVYASSSSVYGGNAKLPFSVHDRTDSPLSLYAASKKEQELIAHAYAHIWRVPATGLRFFTVYGPWGRPDMAAYIFARRIVAGEPIPVFNNGDMRRDFTFIDDIVAGVLAALDRPPVDDGRHPPARLYNLGNSRSEPLTRYIDLIEKALGRKAAMEMLPLQPGDVTDTYADIEDSRRDLGFEPRVTIEEGIPRFVAWFRDYHKL